MSKSQEIQVQLDLGNFEIANKMIEDLESELAEAKELLMKMVELTPCNAYGKYAELQMDKKHWIKIVTWYKKQKTEAGGRS